MEISGQSVQLSSRLGGLAQNSTQEGAIVQKYFTTWEGCSDYVINKMSNYSVIAFTSPFRAFDGQGFYGNVVMGLVFRGLLDNIIMLTIAIDGKLSKRIYNINAKAWDAPSIII